MTQTIRLLLTVLSFSLSFTTCSARTLAERLGYSSDARILIVNADDVGMSHEANAATIDGMDRGQITSGSIMVPCPWLPEIAEHARTHADADFGLHLTHTSEWKRYKWGPVSDAALVPGLVDSSGYFWSSIEQVYAHSSPEQVEIETRAQIDLAIQHGIDVTHLDSHMGTLQFDPAYHAVYLKLAAEYRLPIRAASAATLEAFGMGDRREKIRAQGVLFPDYLIYQGRKEGEPIREYWKRMVGNLSPGVTELYIHPAKESDALKRMTSRWKTRVAEAELFTNDPEMLDILKKHNVTLIGWRELRDLQRQQK